MPMMINLPMANETQIVTKFVNFRKNAAGQNQKKGMARAMPRFITNSSG